MPATRQALPLTLCTVLVYIANDHLPKILVYRHWMTQPYSNWHQEKDEVVYRFDCKAVSDSITQKFRPSARSPNFPIPPSHLFSILHQPSKTSANLKVALNLTQPQWLALTPLRKPSQPPTRNHSSFLQPSHTNTPSSSSTVAAPTPRHSAHRFYRPKYLPGPLCKQPSLMPNSSSQQPLNAERRSTIVASFINGLTIGPFPFQRRGKRSCSMDFAKAAAMFTA